MPDDRIRVEYVRLRDAAIGVLDAMPDVDSPSARVDAALRNLRSVLAGTTPVPSETVRGTPDPFEHSLTARQFVDRWSEPISLPQRAADLRRRLDGDRALQERPSDGPSRDVVITELRAMIVAGLLEELAARVSPGSAFGPGRNGEALALLATDLAKELLAQTFVGE
ncbi:hypothetical protein BJF83_19455 [Nocardiopsis sp. CNR-923]|uniref:hypothetical protein n=1 Tax=Nocardiopsis sp. CNR-923 TaxID=1904965 RepID=UPI0009628111|nr:hypothetical protein [Nocardiopsis sp. CNR-923]OLT27034.1 hypothetical protein BJF83_19455 [Nocardiopsis sp. CNR-923]